MKTKPKTKEGKIAKAFIESLAELTPLVGKFPPAVLRKKTWQVIRRRVPGVTQGVVTRTLFKLQKILAWKVDYEKKWAKRRKSHRRRRAA